jgi:hypothetical protein
MVISDFKWRIWLTLLFAFAFITMLLQGIIYFEATFTAPEGGAMVIFFTVSVLWMLLYEMRTKIISVVFEDSVLYVKNWFGFGKEKQYPLEKITGYHTSALNSKLGDYKVIYIISEDKKIAKISEFYHSNFQEIETYVSSNLINLGKIHTGIISEFRDSFQ